MSQRQAGYQYPKQTGLPANNAQFQQQSPQLAPPSQFNLQQSFQQHNQTRRGTPTQRMSWALTEAEKKQYNVIFRSWDAQNTGFISGQTALEVFGASGLPRNDLARIWTLADIDGRGKLNIAEFHVAMGLIYRCLNGMPVPEQLPPELVPLSTRGFSSSSTTDSSHDATAYEHNDTEIGNFYKPWSRHINRDDVHLRNDKDSLTADLDEMKRKFTNTAQKTQRKERAEKLKQLEREEAATLVEERYQARLQALKSRAAPVPAPEPEPVASVPSIHIDEVASEVASDSLADIDKSIEHRVRSLYPYQGDEPDDLSFGADLILTANPSKSGGDWWYGTLIRSGKSGFFPKTYIQAFTPTKAKSLYSYTGNNSDELPFSEGDELTIIDKTDPEWWKTEQAGVVFNVPAAYLKTVDKSGPPVSSTVLSDVATPTYPPPPPLSMAPKDEALDRELKDLKYPVKRASDHLRYISRGPRSAAKDQDTTLLEKIFREPKLYKRLLDCDGSDAQVFLEVCQVLLDSCDLPSRSRGQIITAMRRLSAKTNEYPSRFFLSEPLSLVDENPINSGSFGDVYKATLRGEVLCMKVLRGNRSLLKQMTKLFAKEAMIWSQFSHCSILPFYGIYLHRSQISFVSPWAENGSIKEYLDLGKSAPERVLLCLDTASGLAYLHSTGVIHGDIKSANVLVDISCRAYLADFGLSNIDDSVIAHWTSQSSVASRGGSARWQAPELHQTENDNDDGSSEVNGIVHNTEMSDVFAWGCLCYGIFTGRLPFYEMRLVTTIVLKVSSGQIPSRPKVGDPAWLEHGLTESIWELMERCWQFDPSARPDMQTVLSRLDLEKPAVDPRPLPQWPEGSAIRFRNSTSVEPSRSLHTLDDLDVILRRIIQERR